MQIKKGEVLERKNGGDKQKVLGILDDDLFFLSQINKLESPSFYPYTKEGIEENFILPKEKWMPEVGAQYLTLDLGVEDGVVTSIWRSDTIDTARLDRNVVFKTKEEAIAAYEKVKEALK